MVVSGCRGLTTLNVGRPQPQTLPPEIDVRSRFERFSQELENREPFVLITLLPEELEHIVRVLTLLRRLLYYIVLVFYRPWAQDKKRTNTIQYRLWGLNLLYFFDLPLSLTNLRAPCRMACTRVRKSLG